MGIDHRSSEYHHNTIEWLGWSGEGSLWWSISWMGSQLELRIQFSNHIGIDIRFFCFGKGLIMQIRNRSCTNVQARRRRKGEYKSRHNWWFLHMLPMFNHPHWMLFQLTLFIMFLGYVWHDLTPPSRQVSRLEPLGIRNYVMSCDNFQFYHSVSIV